MPTSLHPGDYSFVADFRESPYRENINPKIREKDAIIDKVISNYLDMIDAPDPDDEKASLNKMFSEIEALKSIVWSEFCCASHCDCSLPKVLTTSELE